MSDEHGKPAGTEASDQGSVEAPEPLWKQRGYASEAAMVRDLESDKQEAELQAKYLRESAATAPATDVDLGNPYGDMSKEDWEDLYEEDPAKAIKHMQSVAAKQAKAAGVKPEASPEVVQQATIRAAVETAKTQAEKDGYDAEVVWALMHSISEKPENQHLRGTREGVKQLADMARKQIDGSTGKTDGTPPEHQDGGGSGSQSTGHDPFAKRNQPEGEEGVAAVAKAVAEGKAPTVKLIQESFKAHTKKLKDYKGG